MPFPVTCVGEAGAVGFQEAGGTGKEGTLASMEVMARDGVSRTRLSKFGQSTHTETVMINVPIVLGS